MICDLTHRLIKRTDRKDQCPLARDCFQRLENYAHSGEKTPSTELANDRWSRTRGHGLHKFSKFATNKCAFEVALSAIDKINILPTKSNFVSLTFCGKVVELMPLFLINCEASPGLRYGSKNSIKSLRSLAQHFLSPKM